MSLSPIFRNKYAAQDSLVKALEAIANGASNPAQIAREALAYSGIGASHYGGGGGGGGCGRITNVVHGWCSVGGGGGGSDPKAETNNEVK